jgi:D-alanine-D-alanine ligase
MDMTKYETTQIGITLSGQWLSGDGALTAFEQAQTDQLYPVALLGEPGDRKLYRRVPDGNLEAVSDFEAVFPVLHGTFGEDGTIQGLLELAEVPYVGAGVLASSVAMDKGLFKRLMQAHQIPVLDFVLLHSDSIRRDMDAALETAQRAIPYPLFTKPSNMGSSVGVSKCRNRSDLIEGLMEAAQYDRRVLVERGIEAREIEVSVLGNEDPIASVPGEILPSDEFYSYRAKYIDDTSELHIPAKIDESLADEARQLAVKAYTAIDCAGMARVDFLLDKVSGQLFLNEINTIPGFTQISMYPKLWEASGIPYPELMDRLIDLALKRASQREGLVRNYGGIS